MFVYRDGRLHMGSSSFAIPDNCCVNTSLPVDTDNGIVISPADQCFQVTIDYDIRGAEPRCGLEEQLSDWAEPVEIVEETYANCHGWSITYRSNNCWYKQISIPFTQGTKDGNGNYVNELMLLLKAATPDEMQKAEKHRVFQGLVNSIAV